MNDTTQTYQTPAPDARPASNGWLGGENQNKGSQQREVRWLTPPELVAPLGRFDLDPCGAPGHVLADRTYLLENGDDGLRDPWDGRVWLNPPYGKLAEPFLRKLADHGRGVALIFARTETKMFHEQVWGRASAVLFMLGRVSFLTADGVKARANAGAPSCLVAYGSDDAELLRASGVAGQFVDLRRAAGVAA
ncbi:DNA N-6-adenine-methyltransferase [Microbacterium sp. SL75]|uniref:DNA N-6-adenine-methyltransferase n=1 Tax=Microbacterium sp. SL75 TaxID=2995140 RepID=UPI0022708140|nr:DNA N-6-adenine-methyltransferase [Microbacterium sp. SL75]WAC68874.1 DNA N-6-adenine-methyltransferase [Microbacterium sp. SL75]